jgi:hypothetical protein
MLANAIRNSVSPLIENPILPLVSSCAFLLLLPSFFAPGLGLDVGEWTLIAPCPSSALSMTKGENIPTPVPVPKHNEIGLWWWNELGGNEESPSPMSDVGLEGDSPIDDVGLEGGGEEDGEAGGDMFLRMAV